SIPADVDGPDAARTSMRGATHSSSVPAAPATNLDLFHGPRSTLTYPPSGELPFSPSAASIKRACAHRPVTTVLKHSAAGRLKSASIPRMGCSVREQERALQLPKWQKQSMQSRRRY